MDAYREEKLLVLARDLASSHGIFFAAALLADMGVPLPVALATLAQRKRQDLSTNAYRAGLDLLVGEDGETRDAERNEVGGLQAF